MKFDKKLSFLLSYWWVMLLFVLGLAVLAFGNREGGESDRENRTLQSAPELTFKSWFNGSFMSGLENYLSDQIPGRNSILDASAAVTDLFDMRSSEARILAASVGRELEAAGEMGEGDDDLLPQVTAMPAQSAEAEALSIATPVPVSTPVPENAPTPAVTPAPTLTPVPSATPIDPAVKDTSTTRSFYYKKADGGVSTVFHFQKDAMEATISSLNAYRAKLGEDGRVFFTYVPDSQRADKWLFNTKTFVGWHSDAEATIQANVSDGVYVFSSVNELEKHMQAGEPVYFKTDHHWSGLGAYYMVSAMRSSQGVPAMSYNDFTYTVHEKFTGSIYQSALDMAGTGVYDRLEVPDPLAPVIAAEYRNFNKLLKEVRYMEPERSSYSAFLGGTHDPFYVVETGFHTGRNALVICDSFGNAFIPFLAPYYDKVCQIDLREEHTFITRGGGSVSEYIKFWHIDDVYFVVSNGNGINSSYMRRIVRKYL